MKLHVNGKEQSMDSNTVKDLLLEHNFDIEEGGFAVAVNDTVIPKNQLATYKLHEEDYIEIIQATQGG